MFAVTNKDVSRTNNRRKKMRKLEISFTLAEADTEYNPQRIIIEKQIFFYVVRLQDLGFCHPR